MANIVTIYNKLLSVIEADERFVNRDEVLGTLSSVFAKYDKCFGICLVHRHCELQEGEKMVADGLVSKPEKDVECYPERWLPSGEPYEFNRKPSISPPESLFAEFREVVGDLGVLGICYIYEDAQNTGLRVERTVGRTNITEIVEEVNGDQVTTCWLMGPSGTLEPGYSCNRKFHPPGCIEAPSDTNEYQACKLFAFVMFGPEAND